MISASSSRGFQRLPESLITDSVCETKEWREHDIDPELKCSCEKYPTERYEDDGKENSGDKRYSELSEELTDRAHT